MDIQIELSQETDSQAISKPSRSSKGAKAFKRCPQNHVLINRKHSKDKKVAYLVPAYIRFVMRRIKSVNISENYVELGATLYVSIYYRGVQKRHLDYLISNIALIINEEQTLLFSATKKQRKYDVVNDEKKKLLTFVLTRSFNAVMDAKIFYSPFERLYISVSIQMSKVSFVEKEFLEKERRRVISFRFNVMEHSRNQTIFPCTKYNLSYGEYVVATHQDFRKVETTNEYQMNLKQQRELRELNQSYLGQSDSSHSEDENNQQSCRRERTQQAIKVQKQKKISPFRKIEFKAMLFRHPVVSITTIFIPIWIFSMVILLIFFQDSKFSDRVINTATIMISFSSYYGIIRGAVPKSKNVIMLECVVYLIMSTCLLQLARAWLIRNQNIAVWQEKPWQDPFFIAALAVSGGSIIFVIGAFVLYRLLIEPSYVATKFEPVFPKVYRQQWSNVQARLYFQKFQPQLYFAENEKQYLDDPVDDKPQ